MHDTCTVGGAIGGYCAIGSVESATAPASVTRIEMTAAKTGRSMKNREIKGGYFCRERGPEMTACLCGVPRCLTRDQALLGHALSRSPASSRTCDGDVKNSKRSFENVCSQAELSLLHTGPKLILVV